MSKNIFVYGDWNTRYLIRELEQASYLLEKEDITLEEEKNCVQHCCYEYGKIV